MVRKELVNLLLILFPLGFCYHLQTSNVLALKFLSPDPQGTQGTRFRFSEAKAELAFDSLLGNKEISILSKKHPRVGVGGKTRVSSAWRRPDST